MLFKGKFSVIITRHAFERALQRRIHPDLIEECLQSGKIKRFGKNRVKIEKRFRKFTVVCVDELVGNELKIVTIERK